jgi:hypothetical protein
MTRIGVFTCWCGENIARNVDVERVCAEVGKLPGVRLATNYRYLCSDPGQSLIREKIKTEQLDGVVIASCSPHMHLKTFRKAARAAGIDASGPHPADTVFHQAVHNKRFDAIVCMYHDQGHTPMKLLAFESGVNVTVGLPIVRTSVDHGTAFDIAWQGVALTGSLDHALSWAKRLAREEE